MSVWRFVAAGLMALALGACDRAPDHIAVEVELSVDGGPPVTGTLAWSCSYRENHSPFNFGPTIWATRFPDQPLLNLTLADGRMVVAEPPYGDQNRYCTQPGPDGWRVRIAEPKRLFDLYSGELTAAGMPVVKLAVRKVKFTGETLDDQAAPAFKARLSRVAELRATTLNVAASSQEMSEMREESAAVLRGLPTERPSVFRVNLGGGPRAAGRMPRSIPGLPEFDPMSVYSSWGGPTLMPSPDGAPVAYTPQPDSRPGGGRVFTLGGDSPPRVQVPGLDKPITVDPLMAVWFPDRRQLVMFTWADVTNDITR